MITETDQQTTKNQTMDLDHDVVVHDSFSFSLICLPVLSGHFESLRHWYKPSSLDLCSSLPYNPSFYSFFDFFYVASIFSKKIFASEFLFCTAHYSSHYLLLPNRVCGFISNALAFYANFTPRLEKTGIGAIHNYELF